VAFRGVDSCSIPSFTARRQSSLISQPHILASFQVELAGLLAAGNGPLPTIATGIKESGTRIAAVDGPHVSASGPAATAVSRSARGRDSGQRRRPGWHRSPHPTIATGIKKSGAWIAAADVAASRRRGQGRRPFPRSARDRDTGE